MNFSALTLALLGALILCSGTASADKTKEEKKEKSSPHKLEFGGLGQIDSVDYGKFFNRSAERDSDIGFRRLRLTADYRYKKDWRAELSLQHTERSEGLDINQASVSYSGFKAATITAGKFKQSFGLERMEAAGSLSTMERAMVSSALAPGQAIGLQLHKNRKNRTWAIGVFQLDDENDRYDRTAPQYITGRATWQLLRGKKKGKLHLGVAASYSDWNDNPFRINERAEVFLTDNVVRSPRFDANTQLLLGLEAAWQKGPLLLSAEYIATEVDSKGNLDGNVDDTLNFSGYYVQAGYFPGGQRKKYRNGEFKRLRGKQAKGALELVARYSEFDARDEAAGNTIGAHASIAMLGANYHFNKNVKLMANYLHPEIHGDTVHNQLDGDAFTVRVQVRF